MRDDLTSRRHSDAGNVDDHAFMVLSLRLFDSQKRLENMEMNVRMGKAERIASDALKAAEREHHENSFLEDQGVVSPQVVKGLDRKQKLRVVLNRTRARPQGFREHRSDYKHAAHQDRAPEQGWFSSFLALMQVRSIKHPQ